MTSRCSAVFCVLTGDHVCSPRMIDFPLNDRARAGAASQVIPSRSGSCSHIPALMRTVRKASRIDAIRLVEVKKIAKVKPPARRLRRIVEARAAANYRVFLEEVLGRG